MESSFSRSRLLAHFLIGLSGSLIVVAMLFYAAAEPGEGLQPSRVLSAITGSSILLFILFAASNLLGTWLRAIRYRILIQAAGESDQHVPTMGNMFLVTAVRGMAVDLLPSRLGELIYVLLLRKTAGTSYYAGFTSLLFAVMFDVAVLAPFTLLLGFLIGFPNSAPIKVALVALAIIGCFYVGIRFVLPKLVSRIHDPEEGSSRFTGKIREIFLKFNDAIQKTLGAGVFGKVITITVTVRAIKYLSLYMLFHSVAGGGFPALQQLSGLQVIGAMIASEMTATLPVPTLMSFGSWEAGGMTFLALMGAPPGSALVALLAVHIQSQAVDYGIGITALFLLFFGSRLASTTNSGDGARVPGKVIGFALVALASVGAGWYWMGSHSANYTAIESASSASPPPPWMKDLDGFIVWSSNRLGNHDIMKMDLSDGSVVRLTDHPNTETHPRISPDGTRIAFSRSDKEWQSWRDQNPWAIWVKDIASGKEKRITPRGIAPNWSPDGKFLYFQRGLTEIWRYTFASGKEQLMYRANTPGIPNSELYYPSLDANGVLAITYRDRGRPTNIISDQSGNMTTVARGCMLTWSPDNSFALFISSKDGGKQKNQINRYDPATGQISRFLDLPGELSHEYFPRLDPTQRYLVFAASDGAHEPDIEDYEIFLWDTTTPANQAVRLTNSSGNDSWPDIWLRNTN